VVSARYSLAVKEVSLKLLQGYRSVKAMILALGMVTIPSLARPAAGTPVVHDEAHREERFNVQRDDLSRAESASN
jgi:hypothetical protein